MSKNSLRYFVFAAALTMIVASSAKVGWWFGLISLVVPICWLWPFSLRHTNSEISSGNINQELEFRAGADWQSVASCFAVARLIAPVLVYMGEALKNLFATMSGGAMLTYFILRAGAVEEILKLAAVVAVLRFLSPNAIRHPSDGMVLACAAALGFAAYENIFHNLYLAELQTGAFKAFFLGAFIRVPLHPLYAAIWGASFGISRFTTAHWRLPVLAAGLLTAMFFHGLWDTMAQSQSMLVFALMLMLYAALWYGYLRLWKQVRSVPFATASTNQ
jgi:RsiW-degrading membrane proteinase PrsW (M82 family)